MRVKDIAARLGAEWEGEGEREITRAAPLESGGSADIIFVASRKAFPTALSSGAGCLIAPPDFPAGHTIIRSSEPRTAFARAIAMLHPVPRPAPGVHPSAVIDPSARVAPDACVSAHVSIGPESVVGHGTAIGAGSRIGARVRIGRDCTLHANTAIYDDVAVGDRAILHSGCVLGAEGFGFVLAGDHYEKFPQIGRLEIGDDVEIGANTTIDRAALGVTRIGNGVKLDNQVHIGHNCQLGNHVVIAAQTGLSGGVTVGDYAVIGGQVGIGDKARIEARAVLGSGSGVLTSKIVRAGEVLWGTPARPLKEHLQQLANLARLPELRRQLEELKRRLIELEKSAGPERT